MSDKQSQIGGFWLSQRSGRPAWYITWFDASTRQTKRLSTGCIDLCDAEIALAEHVTRRADLKDLKPEEMPLATVLVRYWHEHAVNIASKDTAKHALRLWNDHWGEATVSDLSPKRQKEFIASLKSKGFKNSYVNRVIGVGRAALRFAWNNQEITSVPYIFTEKDRSDEEKAHRMSKAEFATLIKAAHETRPHLYLFIMIMMNTMCRHDAALDIAPCMVDFEHSLVNTNPPGRKRTKKGRPIVPMTDTLRGLFDGGARLFNQPRGGGFGFDTRITDSSIPYVNWNGKPIGDIHLAFAALVKETKLNPKITPYSIRHTMSKELRFRGVPWEEVKGMLGHKLPGVTEVYAEFSPDYLSKGRAAIDAFITELCVPTAFPSTVKVAAE